MRSDWRENVIFYSSLCCHLADRLRVMSGRPDACIVLRLLRFQTPVGKCMTWVSFWVICYFFYEHFSLYCTFLLSTVVAISFTGAGLRQCTGCWCPSGQFVFTVCRGLGALSLHTCWISYVAVRYYHTGKWACRTAGDFQAIVCVYACVCAVTACVYTTLNMLIFFSSAFFMFLLYWKDFESECLCVRTRKFSIAVLAITQSQPGAHH